jgi:hypothetical protein
MPPSPYPLPSREGVGMGNLPSKGEDVLFVAPNLILYSFDVFISAICLRDW